MHWPSNTAAGIVARMGLGRTTPLLAACERGHLAIARLLVERGADKARIVQQNMGVGGVDYFGCLAG